MPGPVVERGERVTFRTVERDDAQFWQRAGTDPRVRFLLGMRRAYNVEESRERIERVTESDATLGYAVCVEDDGPPGHPGEDEMTPIGMVRVQRGRHPRVPRVLAAARAPRRGVREGGRGTARRHRLRVV